ncbi:LysR family transcriptional regulator [Rheinheimera sp. EpRS3]|uniref:LysR family transcriptional regulator n=1 Tax=Rheinheimera sp. EpRS3 TaxID=1712383 RepID=UPI000749987A|nr:LysR family transcriptional regulator [Rheinheimera sp. EpRS3]KUM52597.1 transcriptional regulator [Rheinheimera sp. EpRS3]
MNPSLLPSLAWFAHIARHRSFTRAAEEMGVSRAALSQNLKALEHQLGVKLLYRTTRDMSLTEAGQKLFDTLHPTLDTIEQVVQNLGDIAGEPSGLIRINTSRLAAKALIEPHLADFCKCYPKIKLELTIDDGLSNIIADGYDIGIRLGQSLAEHVVAVPVSPEVSMVVVGSAAYFEQHGIPKTPAELNQHNCINYRFPGSGAIREWDFNEPGKKGRYFTQSVSGSITTNNAQSMTQATLQGIGLSQHLDIAIQKYLVDGSLVKVLCDWTYRHAGFYLYTPSREYMPSKIRALLDFLIEKRDGISLV